MQHFKKNKSRYIAFIFLICIANQCWISNINSMAIPLVMAQIAQLSRAFTAIMDHLNITHRVSLAQQFLADQAAAMQTHSIIQQNLSVPDLHIAYLPPMNISTHQIQSAYKDQMAFMTHLSQKSHAAIEKINAQPESIKLVHTIINKPIIELADLKSSTIVPLITQEVIKQQSASMATAHQMLFNTFAQKNYWQAIASPGSLKYMSPSGRSFVEFRSVTQNSEAVYFEIQQQYAHSLHEMKQYIHTHPEYKTSIEMQIKTAIDSMAKLNSDHVHERLLALDQLSKLHISGPPDIYLQKTIAQILKGYIESDGTIPEYALLEKNNYIQDTIKQFITTIHADLGTTLPLKTWTQSIDLNKIPQAKLYPVSKSHNIRHVTWEFLHLSYDHKSLLNNNKLHQVRLDCIKHAQSYNFSSVEQLIKTYTHDEVMHKIHRHFLQEFNQKIALEQQKIINYKNALFDHYGFYKSCADNPWFTTMTEQEKKKIAAVPEQLNLFNQHLLAQLAIKNELMQRWNIPLTAPISIHQMIYIAMGDQAQNLNYPIAMIDILTDLTKSNKEANQFFFLPNGIFKDLGQTPYGQSLPIWQEMMNENNAETKRALNYLVHIDSCVPNTKMGEKAKDALNNYQKDLLTENIQTIEKKFQRTLNYMVYDLMKEYRVYNFDDLYKKIAPKDKTLAAYAIGVGTTQALKLFQEASAQYKEQSSCTINLPIPIPEKSSICKPKEEKLPELSCGSTQTNATPNELPQETCKNVGNNHKGPLMDGACTTGQAPPQDIQCNHSKQQLPSFQGIEITPENVPVIIQNDQVFTEEDAKAIEKAAREIERAIEEKLQYPTLEKEIEQKKQKNQQKKSNNICIEHNVATLKGKHLHIPNELKDIITNPHEWGLHEVFDGAILTPAEHGHPIPSYPDYQHILSPIIKVNCKNKTMVFSGFHHDYLGTIKKSGLIEYENVIQHPNGFWQADWKYVHGNGAHKFSGFFPDHWTPLQVMEKIIESTKRIQEISLKNNGYLEVTNLTQDNLKIVIVFQINPQLSQAKIITIYPDFRK